MEEMFQQDTTPKTLVSLPPLTNYDALIVPGGFFKWKEYALLKEWQAYAVPTPTQQANAIELFTQIRDLIRVPLDKPISISSGARTSEYVAYLRRKGTPAATKGAHLDWAGVDLLPPAGMSVAEFWHFCDSRWPGRMENLSHTPGWVHLDTRQWGQKVRFNP